MEKTLVSQPNTIITNKSRAILLALALLAFTAQTVAHGGFDHVNGIVAKVEGHVLTVKTAKGDVDVKLAETTEITKSNQKAAIEDLKPGVRVVVDLPEGSKERVAHSVKIGVVAAHTEHATHK
jgi:hypothetical protein